MSVAYAGTSAVTSAPKPPGAEAGYRLHAPESTLPRSRSPRATHASPRRPRPVRLGRAVVLAAALCSLAGSAAGQVYEGSILLPDSMGGAVGPRCLAYDSARGAVYVGSAGGTVHVIDATTCEMRARVDLPHAVGAMCLVEQPDRLYCADTSSGVLSVIDRASNRVLRTVEVGRGVGALCFSPAFDKVYCANRYDSSVAVVDSRGDSLVRAIRLPCRPYALQYNSANDQVYCASVWDTLYVISAQRDSVLAALPAGCAYGGLMCFTPDLRRLYMLQQLTLAVVDCTADSVRARIHTGRDVPLGICYSSACDRVFLLARGHSGPADLLVFDGGGDSLIGSIRRIGQGYGVVATDRDGGRVYCALSTSTKGGRLRVIDARALRIDTILAFGCGPAGVVRAVGEDRLFFACTFDRNVIVYDLAGDSVVAGVLLGAAVGWAALDSATGLLYVSNPAEYGSISIVDVAAGSVICVVRARGAGEVVLSHDGAKLYTPWSSPDGLAVVNCRSGSLIRVLETTGGASCLVGHAERRRLYFRTPGGIWTYMWVVDAASDSVVRVVQDWGSVTRAALVKDKLYSFVGSEPPGVLVYACGADSLLGFLLTGWTAFDACVCLYPPRLYCSGVYHLYAIDATADTVALAIPRPGPTGAVGGDVRHVPDHSKIYWVVHAGLLDEPDSLYAVSVAGDSVVAGMELGNFAVDASADRTGHYLYVICQGDSSLWTVDCRGDSVVRRASVGEQPGWLMCCPAAGRVLVRTDGSRLLVYRDTVPGVGLAGGPATRPKPVGSTVLGANAVLTSTGLTEVYDVSGRVAARLPPGENDVRVLAPGVYFLRSGGQSRRVVLVR